MGRHTALARIDPWGGKWMKRILTGVSLVLVMAAAGYFVPAYAQGPTVPRLRLANAPPQREIDGNHPSTGSAGLKLRWYGAGHGPLGIAFDGANIWTANYNGGTVTKLRASDGKRLGTFDVGAGPAGVTFDGTNIWVSNSAAGTLTKLRASDGKKLGTFSIGPAPWWMAFDGSDLWVTTT